MFIWGLRRNTTKRIRFRLPFFMELIFVVCLLWQFLSLSAAATLKYECPEPTDIFPCYCEEEDGDPEVFCNHLSTPEQMYEGVKGLNGYRIYKMSFFMNWILDPIKSDAFKDLAIERILFENSTVSLTSPQFKGLENHLNSVQFRAIYNSTNPVVSLELDHLKSLREIIFDKNRITALPNDWLKSVPDSIRSLSVEENTIVSLGDEIFAKVKQLSFLVLDFNRIVIIKRSMFPTPADQLRSIGLSNNRIRYLSYDVFSEMPSLRSLDMSGNRLTTLDESIWLDVFTQLTKLDVSGNALVCDKNLKWLYTDTKFPVLFFGHCQEPERLRNKSLKDLKGGDLS